MGKRREYWAMVAGRAWREAIAAAPWSSSVKLIAAIAALGAAVAWGWHNTGKPEMGAVWGFTVVGMITVGTVLFKLWWAVPADLAAESADREAALNVKLASYDGADDDESIRSAIAYVALGGWAKSFWDGNGEGLNTLNDALEDIRKRALRGKVQVWGRGSNPVGLHVKIPALFWEYGRIELLTVTGGQEITTSKYGAHTPPRYHDLRINRAEFEREWPKRV